jgi:DNA-directed RNA polymerase subunit RPC12/RpoP
MGIFSRLLGGRAGCACSSCGKQLRPYAPPGGFGAALDLNPKIEQDHGFRCERCQKMVCPVCSGQRAGQLGLRDFVCTSCGHTPLRTLHR